MRTATIPYLLLACSLSLLWHAESARGQEPRMPTSAWDSLVRRHHEIPSDLTPFEREVLSLMTPAQAEDFAQGTDASLILLLNGQSLDVFLKRTELLAFDLSWYSVDGGGGTLSGGDFRLTGVAGQMDAGSMNGGAFRLIGGFFASTEPDPIPPCTAGDLLFCDSFESGDFQAWSQVVSGT